MSGASTFTMDAAAVTLRNVLATGSPPAITVYHGDLQLGKQTMQVCCLVAVMT